MSYISVGRREAEGVQRELDAAVVLPGTSLRGPATLRHSVFRACSRIREHSRTVAQRGHRKYSSVFCFS